MAIDRRPDILLVVLDTLTADAAGLGRSPARMPFLQSLADGGVVFRHAVSNAPWTLPAHASLFSGLLPSEHGIDLANQFALMGSEKGLAASLRGLPRPAGDELRARWLPALLGGAGYETIAASNNPWVSRLTGFGHGFRWIRDAPSIRLPAHRRLLRSRPRIRSYGRAVYATLRALRGGDQMGRALVRSIDERLAARDPSRPSFVFVNLIEAHAPYVTPSSPDAIRAAGAASGEVLRAMLLAEPRQTLRYNLVGGSNGRAHSALQLQRALQRASAAYLDLIVKILYEHTRRPSRPIVAMMTSDHGESFGEHEAMSHGFTLDEPALHVPLVVAGDDVEPAERLETVDLRSLHSAVLAAGGIALPGAAPSPLDGAGRMGSVVAERGARLTPEWLGALSGTGLERAGRLVAVYRDGWKLVVTSTGTRLYDLRADPREERDVAGANPRIVRSLSTRIPGEIAAERGVGDDRELTGQETDQMIDRLRAMGYLE